MIAKRHAFALAASGAVLAGTAGYVLAQDQDDQEKSRFIRFVEEQLSTPNRQIRLNGIEGTLSSNVSFESITIADENGVWLRIENPSLQWQRSALILGRLDISNLSADRIEWPRNPVPDESLPAPESSGFSLPELPVSVDIGELAIGEARFGEPVFGLASTLSLEGQISLGDGTLDTDLDITRLDPLELLAEGGEGRAALDPGPTGLRLLAARSLGRAFALALRTGEDEAAVIVHVAVEGLHRPIRDEPEPVGTGFD